MNPLTDVVVKTPRYITLLGDDIAKKGELSKIFHSQDTTTTIAGALLAWATNPENLESQIIGTLKNNLIDVALNRYFFERWFLNHFSKGELTVDSQTLKDLCIDTDPDHQMIFESTRKYGPAIRQARLMYGIFTAVDSAFLVIPPIASTLLGVNTPETMRGHVQLLADNSVNFSRHVRGALRLNKLAKGEWAIVTTPEGQEYKEASISDLLPEQETAPAI